VLLLNRDRDAGGAAGKIVTESAQISQSGFPLERARILVVDDDPAVLRAISRMLGGAGYQNVTLISDARDAVAEFAKIDPDIVLLDLNMPYISGMDLLTQIIDLRGREIIPLIMITGDAERKNRMEAIEIGASDFLSKPFDPAELQIRIRNLLTLRFANLELRDLALNLDRRVNDQTVLLRDSQFEIVQRLAKAAEYRDDDSGMHVARVSWYSAHLFEATGAGAEETQVMLQASQLHDVGKIGIPDAILNKPGTLDEGEWELMKTHTAIGGAILAKSRSEILKMAEEIALSHHEKWDGGGYPAALSGEEIPLSGRIVAICDVLDALTSERPYKSAWPLADALEEIKRLSGSHFDPSLVEKFFSIKPVIVETFGMFRE
jgi:putative two-component system response regulator